MKRFTLTLILAICAMAMGLHAQMVNPIQWATSAQLTSDTEGVIKWDVTIEPGWHLYDLTMPEDLEIAPQVTSVTIDPSSNITLVGELTPSVPAEKHYDEQFEATIGYWEKNMSFTQKFKLAEGTQGAVITGRISFQACDDSRCIPPGKDPFEVVVGTPPAEAVANESKDVKAVVANNEIGVPAGMNPGWWAPVEYDAAEAAGLDSTASSWWELLLWGFLGGLVALMTPCVWPMIPMTMSFFLKRTKDRAKSMRDAITYGLSIIIIFLVLGLAITGIFGAGKLNDLATSALFNLIFFALLVIFAISFFGAFDIKLPSSWSNKIDNKAEETTGLLSIFFMAFTLVLVSFSCTGPIIGTLLVEAAASGSISGPAWGMGGFALGLALPFGLFAFFPSLLQGMPKSGGWLNSVKVVLGFLELILSLKFLSVADLAYGWGILDREVFVSLWIVLFFLMGMYLLGKLRFPHDDIQQKTGVFPFFLAVISFAFGVYLVPGLWGAPLKSVSAFVPPLFTQDFNLYRADVHKFDNYEDGMQYAADNNLPVLVDFSGFACVNCRKMEGAVFDTDDVRSIIESEYVLITLMVDDKAKLSAPYEATENGQKIYIETVGEKWSFLQRYKFATNSQPYYVILDNDGNMLEQPRVYDENVQAFVDWLTDGIEAYKKN